MVISVDAPKGEQFKPSFFTVHPNARLPAIADGDATVFDSNAILLYRIEKTGRYLPENAPDTR